MTKLEKTINDAMDEVMAQIVAHVIDARERAIKDRNKKRRAKKLRAWSKLDRDMEAATETFQRTVERALKL